MLEVIKRLLRRIKAGVFPTVVSLSVLTATNQPVWAVETWATLDKRLKPAVYQLNVGVKIRLKIGLWAQFSDASPKSKFAVFSATPVDQGFQVVSWGSAFPVKTLKGDKTYFLTSNHLVDADASWIHESQSFFAAMRLYAEQTARNGDVDGRFRELISIVDLCLKGGKNLVGQEKTLYQTTVDTIWDVYDANLSTRVDRSRDRFNRYLSLAGVEYQTGYFLHSPGPTTAAGLDASLYRAARQADDPDLAILSVPNDSFHGTRPGLEIDAIVPSEGEEIQVIGYPAASNQIDYDRDKYYSPTFSNGRISRVAPRLLQIDAPVTNGNSGGPVISLRGKVLGVVTRRAIDFERNVELKNFGGAMPVSLIKSFAPELFGR